MGKKQSTKKEKGSENGGGLGRGRGSLSGTVLAPIGDPRFSRLHTDPRFQRLPKAKAKVAIDSRFAHMFTEKAFSNPSANKRGIESKSASQVYPLRRYYKVDKEEDDEEDEGGDGDDQVDESITKKKRGRKDCAKKMKEAITTVNEEIDESDDSRDELGPSTFKTDVSSVSRKQKGKKDQTKKRGIGAKPLIAEAKVHTEDTEEKLEEVNEAEDVPDQTGRAGTGSMGTKESDEELKENDESGPEEGRQEDDEEDDDDGEGSSSSSSSSESESDVDEDISGGEDDEKIPTTNDETRRLAIVNMDWEHIRAVHLLVLMRSFAPKGGSVHTVTVYPSEFGVEQMKEENVHGPKSIFRQNDEEGESDEEGADPEKLRQYEKGKLRYFYAVVDCDSASTAAHLYKNCDGLEFERTSNTLDLRYIPDAMEFKRDLRDSASEAPVDYQPIQFETRALQHSNVKLTWDDDEPVRAKALRRNFNRHELNEMGFRAYVASSSESESEGEAAEDGIGVDEGESMEPTVAENKKEKLRSKYLSLLAGTEEEADMVRGKKAEKGNIEIKFHTGLDELSEKLPAKTNKDEADETVWEAYLRRKKEKKNALNNKKSTTDSDLSSDDKGNHSDGLPNQKHDPFFGCGDEDPFDDPFFNQDGECELPGKARNGREGKEGKTKDLNWSKKEDEQKKKKEDAARETKESEKKQAELELLLLDDPMVQNGEEVPLTSSLKDSVKNQCPDKNKKKKGGKGKMEELQEKIASTANYDDPRFASLFTSHLFALDPTDPQFKNTGSRVAEMQRQHFQSSKISHERPVENSGNQYGEQGGNRKRNAEVSSLVRSLKSKAQPKTPGNGCR